MYVDTLRELTSEERKAAPVWGGVLSYFPDALMAVARISKAGNDKHNPGEPLHWARGKSMDQEECIVRHMLNPYATDADSGELHLTHAAWRTLAALQLHEEARLIENGIQPLSGVQTW